MPSVDQLKMRDVAPDWAKAPMSFEELQGIANAFGLTDLANMMPRYRDDVEQQLSALRAPIKLRGKLRAKGLQPPLSNQELDDWARHFLQSLVTLGAMTEAEVQEGLRALAA